MPRQRKTYGYARKSQVPDYADTKVKVCPKCDHWFAARKRARICDGCQPAWKRAQMPKIPAITKSHATTKAAKDNEVKAQVRAYEKTHPETMMEAKRWDGRVDRGMPPAEAWNLEEAELTKRLGPKLARALKRNIAEGKQAV